MYSNQVHPQSAFPQQNNYPPPAYHQHLQQQQAQHQQQQQIAPSNQQQAQQQQFHVNGNNNGGGSNPKTLSKLLTSAPTTRPTGGGSRQQQQPQHVVPPQPQPNGTPMQRPQQMMSAAASNVSGTLPNGTTAIPPNEMRGGGGGSNMHMTKQMMLEQQQQQQQRMYMYQQQQQQQHQQQNPQAAQNGYMNGHHPQSGGHAQNQMMANQQQQQQYQRQLQQQQQAHSQLTPQQQQQLLQQRQQQQQAQAQMFQQQQSQNSQEFNMMNGPSTSYSHPQQNANNPIMQQHQNSTNNSIIHQQSNGPIPSQVIPPNPQTATTPMPNSQQTSMVPHVNSVPPPQRQQQQFINGGGHTTAMNNSQQQQIQQQQLSSRPMQYQQSTMQGFAPQQPSMNSIRHSYPPQPLPNNMNAAAAVAAGAVVAGGVPHSNQKQQQTMMQQQQQDSQQQMQHQRNPNSITSLSDLQIVQNNNHHHPNSINNNTSSFPLINSNMPAAAASSSTSSSQSYPTHPSALLPNGGSGQGALQFSSQNNININSNNSNSNNSSPNEKRQQIQRQLMLLLHANKCKQRDLDNPTRANTPCGITFCSTMKSVLNHMGSCRNGAQCNFPHCASSSQIISHWKKCDKEDCSVCKPLKESAKQNQNSQRLSVEQEMTNGMMATLERDNEAIIYTKPWQASIDKTIKNHLVCKLVKAIFPSPDPAAMHDQRIKDLISYARRIEKDIFEAADSKEEYYEMLAMKIYKIQKELLDKRNKRLGMQNRGPIENGPSFAMIKQEFQPDLYLPEPPTRQNAAEFLEIKREEYFYPEHQQHQQEQNSEMMMVDIKREESSLPSIITNNNNIHTPAVTTMNVSSEIKSEHQHQHQQQQLPSIKQEQPSSSTTKMEQQQSESEEPIEDVIPPEELYEALLKVWKKVDSPEEAIHFRIAVDPLVVGYYEMIKNPMDLTKILQKLCQLSYRNPWDFANDMLLMIDNAYIFNKKSTKIYKCATRLLEIFTEEMEPLMKSLGYCCGSRYTFTALPLFCYGQSACTIARNQEYYLYEASSSKYGVNVSEKYIYCVKCYEALPDCGINMNENPEAPPNYVSKDKFINRKNDEIENEPFESCKICRRKWHKICANYSPKIFNDGFICNACRETKNIPRPENRYTAKKLATCELSKHLESRVNNYMISKLGEDCAHEVVIRVLHSSDKEVKTKPLIKQKYGVPETFPYRNKVVFAFEVINDIEICFFGLHVQEYGSECSPPNARRVYIAYLDSVHFFEPAKIRTDVYHEILLGYLDYARKLGYTMAHLWACPPSEGDDYIFHCHPPEQKIPKQKRLGNWYKTMLDKAIIEDVVVEYKDIHAQAKDDRLKTPAQLPYFEGDFWPNVIEDCIKDIEKKNGGGKSQELMDFEDNSTNINEENGKPSSSSSFTDKKGSSTLSTTTTTMKKSASSKKLKSSSAMDEVTDRLFGILERHKDVFFTIKLRSTPEWSVMPIKDPDALISCELMDGRDNFLTRAREEHWEFSSLRRAQYSTLCLCHALHSSDNMDNTYTCNYCQQSAIWHCDICPDFDLCNKCHGIKSHEHKLSKVTSIIDVNKSDSNAAREESIRRGIQVLAHASQCRDVNCRRSACTRLKQVLQHVRTCKRRQEASCPICKQLIALCCHHAKVCTKPQCTVPFCPNIRQKLQEQRQLQNRRAEMMMRRRMKLVQSDSPPQQLSQKCDS